MADGRMLRRSIAICEELERVSLEADYLFMRCIPFLDVEGRMVGAPGKVRALVCPLRPEMTTALVERCLGELHDAGLVIWYDSPDGRVLAFPTFDKHNNVRKDREAASTLPPPPSGPTPGVRRENAGSAPGNCPPEGKQKGSEVNVLPACLPVRAADADVSGPSTVRPATEATVAAITGFVMGDLAGAALMWTIAMNRGVTDAHGEQPVPIRHDGQLDAAQTLLEAGVDVAWGADWLYHRAKRSKRRSIPRSLAYVADGLREAWAAHLADARQREHAAAFAPGADPTPRDDGRGVALAPGMPPAPRTAFPSAAERLSERARTNTRIALAAVRAERANRSA